MENFSPCSISSPTPILNYSTGSELSNKIASSKVGIYEPLQGNVLIENETILSKNTNESINKVIEQLSLLKRFQQGEWNSAQSNASYNVASLYSSSIEDMSHCNTNQLDFSFECPDVCCFESTELSLIQAINSEINDFMNTNGKYDLSVIYGKDSLIGKENALESPKTNEKNLNSNIHPKELNYIPLLDCIDFQYSNQVKTIIEESNEMNLNTSNLVNLLEGNTLIESSLDLIASQDDSQQNSISESNASSLFIHKGTSYQNLKFGEDLSINEGTKKSPIKINSSFNHSKNKLDDRKKALVKNKLKQYEQYFYKILDECQTEQEICKSKFHLSQDVQRGEVIPFLFINRRNKSDFDFSIYKCDKPGINRSTKSLQNENSYMNDNIKNNSKKSFDNNNFFSSEIEECKNNYSAYQNIEEFINYLKKSNSHDNLFNYSTLHKIMVNEGRENFQNKRNDFDVKPHNRIISKKNINVSTSKSPQATKNKLNLQSNENYYRSERNNDYFKNILDSLNLDAISFSKNKQFPEFNLENRGSLQNISNRNHLNNGDGTNDTKNDNLLKTISNTSTVKIINSINSAEIGNENKKRRLKIYSSNNFSNYCKIKFDITEIIKNTQTLKTKSTVGFLNKNSGNDGFWVKDREEMDYDINYASEDSSKYGGFKLVQRASSRIPARFRKQYKVKSKIEKNKTPSKQITEQNMKTVVHKVISTAYRSENKSTKKKEVKKIDFKISKQTNTDIKLRLRQNSQTITSKVKKKVHIKTIPVRKFLSSKLQSSFKTGVLLDREDIVEKINLVISNVLLKRGNLSAIISKFKRILYSYNICKTFIEFYTFIMNYTPLKFQEKIIPLGGAFGCKGPRLDKKLSDFLIDT